ncbi:MAG TPA: hypothetical protein VGP69_15250 [Gaiellaceae bacterium]|jgi:hypothetical protein|nr:hypothetical protein [Gaiellaceae bacterium]
MPSAEFDQLWLPRIGAEGVRLARRSATLTVAFLFVVPALMLAYGFAAARGYPVLAVVFLAAALVYVAVWLQSRRQLAAGLSRHFGVEIAWPRNMPNMRTTEQFDAWVRQHVTAS